MLGSTRSQYIAFKKYMRPSAVCQACLSYSNVQKDYLLTCDLCRSCIHSQHYGSDSIMEEPWKCQRCRCLLQQGPDANIKCAFCPILKGIMKQYIYETEKVWLHPECAVWGYPTISFTNHKRNAIQKAKPKNEADYFWTPDITSNQFPCLVCNNSEGYRIRCKYYSCKKSYHITCAISLGVVRDLESMKIQKTGGGGYFPVYCRDHIEKKTVDYKKRAMQLEKIEKEKSAHFRKVSHLYEVQLKNLDEAAEKYKKEEKVIQFLNEKAERTIHEGRNLQFSSMEDSYESNCPEEFLNIIENEIVGEGLELHSLSEVKKLLEEKGEQSKMEEVNMNGEVKEEEKENNFNYDEMFNQLL